MHPEFATVRAGALIVSVKGCDLTILGIGPVEAIRQAVRKANSTFLDQMDRIEINEDMSKTNVHGGAISLGHALGASGRRILAHLALEFADFPDHKYHCQSGVDWWWTRHWCDSGTGVKTDILLNAAVWSLGRVEFGSQTVMYEQSFLSWGLAYVSFLLRMSSSYGMSTI
jgi:hypothetical protein